ncbi:alginate lyase-domain-containing protein [Jimgerdemannia flammicorona]|uniref:Alginate lyase-domain-containing protein n=1 Tax=Jimgerdemannia flammicorona TaxID=994334 RepID=A0A433QBW5_9FUNG|nr:alginate lyase-domain-containing protein [Jimgerdemannia flammicorona]
MLGRLTTRNLGNTSRSQSDGELTSNFSPTLTSRTIRKAKNRSGGLPTYVDVSENYFEKSNYSYYHHKQERSTSDVAFSWAIYIICALLITAFFSYVHLYRSVQTLDERTHVPAVILEPHCDQIVLYRILGNDLPPRHKQGQTLSNLRFILEHEPSFPKTKKYWILNRMVDPANEAAIIKLLKKHQQDYVRIPFEADEYLRQDFRLEDFPEPDFFHSDEYARFSKVAKLRTIDYTYHEKNLYAMNNNGGRNAVLAHAKRIPEARWIMPFDGNCFITAKAFQDIQIHLEQYGNEYKYFVVPMARLLNNTELLANPDERPKTPEEPQVMFRYDAEEVYNLNMRYGRRSKLELLWRIGALENRRSLNKPVVPWEAVERPYSKDKGNFMTVGWVFRLFSGQAQQEENKKEATSIRAFNRLLGIQDFLDGLDEKLARKTFRQENLFLYDEQALTEARFSYWGGDAEVTRVVDELNGVAEGILEVVSIGYEVDKSVTVHGGLGESPENIKKHGHFLKAPFMDQANKPLPSMEAPPARINEINLGYLFQNVTTLTLAHFFTRNPNYGLWAANMIRVHFLNEYAINNQDDYHGSKSVPDEGQHLEFLSDQGYSFPSLNRVPRIIPKYSNWPVPIPADFTTTDISYFLDAIRLLRRGQYLTHKEYVDLQSIMTDFLEYLVNSPSGIKLAQAPDHRAVLYDLQVAALATFTDDLRLYLRIVNRCRMRIGKHFLPNGQQPYQTAYANAKLESVLPPNSTESPLYQRAHLHYTTLNLQYWTLLSRAIQNTGVGRDVWHYTAKDGGRLSRAVISHTGQNFDILDSNPVARRRLIPLLHMAQAAHIKSDAARGIRHDWGDDHDYFERFQRAVKNKWGCCLLEGREAAEAEARWSSSLSSRLVWNNGNSGDVRQEAIGVANVENEGVDEAAVSALWNYIGGRPDAIGSGIPPYWMLGIA